MWAQFNAHHIQSTFTTAIGHRKTAPHSRYRKHEHKLTNNMQPITHKPGVDQGLAGIFYCSNMPSLQGVVLKHHQAPSLIRSHMVNP